jgi:hypothetical protein
MDSMSALNVWMFPFALDVQDDFPRFANWQQYGTKEGGRVWGVLSSNLFLLFNTSDCLGCGLNYCYKCADPLSCHRYGCGSFYCLACSTLIKCSKFLILKPSLYRARMSIMHRL